MRWYGNAGGRGKDGGRGKGRLEDGMVEEEEKEVEEETHWNRGWNFMGTPEKEEEVKEKRWKMEEELEAERKKREGSTL